MAGLIDWAASLPNPPTLPECRPSDVVTIIYTSGTTGTPKGVTLTHANIVGELESIFGAVHADENDALLCLLPLQHVLASVINVLVPLYLGGQVVFADTLKRAEILQALQEAGITILATVPQFFYLFHDRIREEIARKPAAWQARLRHFARPYPSFPSAERRYHRQIEAIRRVLHLASIPGAPVYIVHCSTTPSIVPPTPISPTET